MSRFAAALGLLLAMTGAALAAPVRMEIASVPQAGAETTAQLGEPLASTSAMEAIDAIVTKQAYTAGGLTVPAGRLSMWRSYPDGRLFQAVGSLHRDAPPGESELVIGGIFVPNAPGAPARLYRMDYRLGPVFYDAPGIAFTETSYQRSNLTSTKHDLVFTGLADGKATFVLREFEGDMVRPARTETSALAVKPGAEIKLGGARIRILAAGERELRYVVLAPLDPVVQAPQVIPDPPDADDDEPIQRPMRPSEPEQSI